MLAWILILLVALFATAVLSTVVPAGFGPRRDGCSRIVFFDGDCGLCNRTIRTLMKADRKGILRFAPLQGRTAGLVLPEPLRREALESTLVYYRESSASNSERLLRYAAVLAVCDDLGVPLRLCTFVRHLPASWLEAAYRWVAARRKNLAPPACPLSGKDHRLLP